MRNKIFTVALLLSVFTAAETSAQNWQNYPYSPPGTDITFPDDDGVHFINTTTEWWYVNMHLIGSAPAYREYDVMLCYFRLPANMRIFNIAESSTGIFNTSVQFPPLMFTQQTGEWEFAYTYGAFPALVIDSSYSTFSSSGIPYQYVFKADNPDNNDMLNLTLTSNRPPLIVGGDGYVAIGDQGDSSFYYSYSNMSVEGIIKFNGVQDNITSGIAWIDRQWGPFTVGINTDNMYEWFSLQMDEPGAAFGDLQSPSEFNIWQIFSDSNNVPYKPESRSVSAIYSDDTQDTSSTFYFERLGYWYYQADDVYYSQGWRFIDPLHGVNIDITQTIDDQVVDVTMFRFWEGGTILKGTVNNQPVEGVGFAELVAGHDSEIICPSPPSGLTVVSNSDHYSLSWSAGTPGTYPLGGYRIYRSFTDEGYWQYIASTSDLFYDDYASLDLGYYYTVSSFDDQTATSGSDYAGLVWAPSIINYKPVAIDDTVTTEENIGVVIDVQANDTDPNGDSLTTSVLSVPGAGTANVLNGDSIDYIPNTGFTGTDTIIYMVCDNRTPLLCDTAMVIIIVSPYIGIAGLVPVIHDEIVIYPNPFSTNTTIGFFLHQSEQASLKIFDLTGREVRTLLNDKLIAGKHSISISVKDLPAGIYLLKLQTNHLVQQKLIEVIK